MTLDEILSRLPSGTEWMASHSDARRWLESLPERIAECSGHWNLKIGSVFPSAYVSLPFEAVLADGTEAVLKMQFPHRESDHEADALELWDGDGAVRLISHNRDAGALLVERCRPGRPLSESGQERALDVLISLLPRLWKRAGTPFRSLKEEAARWADALSSKSNGDIQQFEPKLLDIARYALASLPDDQGEEVLLHQDLHGGNVLSAEREPWLVIDPKPLVGEREFSVAPIVRSFDLGGSRKDVNYRFDRLTDELGLDRQRARLWTIAQSVAWGLSSDAGSSHLLTVRWMAEGL